MSLQDLPSQIFADAEVRVGRMLAIQAEIARLQEMADRFEGETRSILSKIGGPDLVDALFQAVADRVAGHPLVTLDEIAPRGSAMTLATPPVVAPPAAPATAPAATAAPATILPPLSPSPPRVIETPTAEQIVDLGDDRLDYFGVPIAKNHLGMAREIVQEARDAVKANDRTGLAKYARRFGRVAWKRHLYFAIWRIECTGFNEAEHFPGDAAAPTGVETAAASHEPATFPDPPFDGEQAAIVSYAQAVGTNPPADVVPEEPSFDDITPTVAADVEAKAPSEPDLITDLDDDTVARDEIQEELTDDDLPAAEADASSVEPHAAVTYIDEGGYSADQRPEEAEVATGNATTVVSLDPPQVAMEVRTSGPGELRLGAPRLPPAAPPMGRPPHGGPRPAPAPVQAQLSDDTTFGEPDGAPGFDLAQQPPLFDDALPDFLKTPAASPAPPPRAVPPGAPRRFAPGL